MAENKESSIEKNQNPQEETDYQRLISNENFNDDNINEIPRETIMNIYGNDFENLTSLISKEETKVKKYFTSIQKNINEKYIKFHSNINSHLRHVTNKITDSFIFQNSIDTMDSKNTLQNKEEEKSLLIQKYSKDYIKRIEIIISIQNQILQSIKETVNIFLNFLEVSNNLDKEKPVHDFVGKEFKNIINSWLFLKLNLEKFDYTQAINGSGLDDNLKKFILKICEGKNYVMNINLPKEYLNEGYIRNISIKDREKIINEKNKNIKILKNNSHNLGKLNMSNIVDIESYFNDISSFNNMKSFKVKNISFKNSNNEILKKFKNLEKLSINNTKNFELKILQNLSQNLKSLSLSNNNFVDFEFKKIMNEYLKKSNSLRSNLEYLSFSKNNLSYIDLTEIINQKSSFFNLKNIDFSKNSIYKFNIPLEFFSELKCINLCNNNFSKDFFTNAYKDIIFLQSGNMHLSNLNLAKIYFNDISKKLNSFQIKLIYLNLSFIPDLISNDYLCKLKINDAMSLGLKKINFSYNKITNDTFFTFINNNKGMLNLKSLNLKGNQLDDIFFEKYLNLKLNNKFTKLKNINLEENLIGEDAISITPIEEEGDDDIVNNKIYKIRLLYKFIAENKSLIKMSITKNPLFNSYEIYDMNSQYLDNFFKVNRYGNIIIHNLNSFLLKIKKEMIIKNDESNNDYNRSQFNLKFDCQSAINQSSESFTNNNEWF